MRNRLALFLSALIAVFALGTATASAAPLFGDVAVKSPAPTFRLNPFTLEPGAFEAASPLAYHGVEVASHIDVTEKAGQVHITVKAGANFSVDQVLIAGKHAGYEVYNRFSTGAADFADEDIDPGQTATDLAAPKGSFPELSDVIVVVSDHPNADQNEPYVENGLPGEVAAIDRPVIQPVVSSLGVSAIAPLHTYKFGFGYVVKRWYESAWKEAFNSDYALGYWHGDPQAFDVNHDGEFDFVSIMNRAEQPGVQRYNDMDETGELYSGEGEKTSYGQPVVFSRTGDLTAFLDKSLPGTINGGGLLDVFQEAFADQTAAPADLFTFTTEGDLPLAWAVKASLAPEQYGRKVEFTFEQLRAWNAEWQAYYAGKGSKPALPLAPGTNSPAYQGDLSVIVNLPETRPTAAAQAPMTIAQAASQQAAAQSAVKGATAKSAKASLRSARVVRTKSGRVLKVFVRSTKQTARIQIRMYSAVGRKVGQATKTVRTNRTVTVKGLHIASKVKQVKVRVVA